MNTTTKETKETNTTTNTTTNNTTREQRYNTVHENNPMRVMLAKIYQDFSADYDNLKAVQADHNMSEKAAKQLTALGKLLHKEHAAFITKGQDW